MESNEKMAPESEKPKGPPIYKRIWFWILALVICVAGGVGGSWLYHEMMTFVSTNDAHISAKRVSIAPDIPGRILKIHVHEGCTVQRGDLLVDLDPSIYLAKREKALRQLVKNQKIAAQSEQKRLKIEEDFNRINAAFQSGIATKKERDDMMRDSRMAYIGESIARIDAEIAQAGIELIDEEMRHLKIYAPCSGVIAKRWLWEGDTAAFGQSIFILNDLSDLWVTANLEETRLTHVRLGDPVQIHVDAYPDVQFVGKVFSIKAMAASEVSLLPPDNATGNYTKVEQRVPIKITLEPMERQHKSEKLHLFPGMSVEIKMRIR